MIDIGTDELYELASIAKSDPYGHPYEQVLDNFDNFRCLMTPSLIMWLIDSLREAEKDAARYRWLCEQAWFQVESEWQLILCETETEDDFIICANEKIDQAMKEKGDE